MKHYSVILHLIAISIAMPLCYGETMLAQVPQPPREQNRKPAQDSNAGWVREAPTMPNLPDYTGKHKYVRGCVNENKLGKHFFCTYNAKENPSDVLHWYQSALPSYNWKVEQSENNNLHARHRDGHTLTIMVGSPESIGKERFHSSFTIVYQVVGKHN